MEQRDLSFTPVSNAHPGRLTPAQIDYYNTQGYIRPIPIFDDAGVAQNRQYFDSLLAQQNAMRDGRDSYAIRGYQIRCGGIWDIATHPLILDYVQDLIGPDIICWGTHFFCKLPNDPKAVPWHQDASYWPLTPARSVTVWLAIDDADTQNAAMQFLPGTHTLGPLNWKETDKPAVLEQEIVNIDQYGQPVADELKSGEISLHADMLAHGSTPNPSGRRRCGLTMRYCPPSVHAINPEWASQSILCRGKDSSGEWANVPRPNGDDMSPKNHPKPFGGN